MPRKLLMLALICGVTFSAAALLQRSGAAADAKPAPAAPRTTEQKETLKKFMRKKLDASNSILEGLTTEDYDLIANGAAELTRASSADEWRVSNDALYRQHSEQFRRIAGRLEKQAEARNLDGAALVWLEGTMSCIECHKWVRSTLISNR